MPQTAPTFALGRDDAGGSHGNAHRRCAQKARYLREKHLPPMQRLAACARLVRAPQRAPRAAYLVVRDLRIRFRNDRIFPGAAKRRGLSCDYKLKLLAI